MLLIISILPKKNFNTSNITNIITRHNHNNYEHNVIKNVHKHTKHINNYDTENNYFSKKSLIKNNTIISIMIILILERLRIFH